MTDAYYYWLIELIGDGQIELCYQRLLRKLYLTPFYYELDYDRNRAEDGLQLRKKFNQYIKDTVVSEEGSCSVLEMFIALSQRAELSLIYDPQPGNDMASWFWMILTNLGLDEYDDNYYFEGRVNAILYDFMHHCYDADGCRGGAFPCPGIRQDLRKTDLWWQLDNYFQRNFSLQIL